jgi:hypothetical protein
VARADVPALYSGATLFFPSLPRPAAAVEASLRRAGGVQLHPSLPEVVGGRAAVRPVDEAAIAATISRRW